MSVQNIKGLKEKDLSEIQLKSYQEGGQDVVEANITVLEDAGILWVKYIYFTYKITRRG